MHFITGGAYNGKAVWVRNNYALEEQDIYHWFSAYLQDPLPNKELQQITGYVVLEGIEQWALQWSENKSLHDARKSGRQFIEKWLQWEQQQKENKLIIIGTDISKGIVPMDAAMRKWRDVTGWFYQDIVKQADRVDIIWYTIAKKLK